ncbi:MAG: VWA domain-containing protein [Chitinivibrionales bacterium]|nr:VWA domain-containing protein [Chitinivibrionales bacterium]
MRFGSPQFFWLLAGIPVLVGFFIRAWQLRQNALKRFASPSLMSRLAPNVRHALQMLKWIFFICFFIFCVFALVRPRFGAKMEMMERKGVDIIIALDISKSMLAEDIAPNRLERAKYEIGKFIDLCKGDRIGLVVFAGESFVQCPLTLDYAAAKIFLDVVETDWIPIQGTALAQAIEHSNEAFHSKARKHKVLIILSDGEDHEGESVKMAKEAAGEGVKIYTVGIGSENGVPIPVKKRGGNVVYKKDRNSNLVMTRLNPVTLEKIALEGNGKFFHAGTNLDLEAIYEEIMKMEKKDLGTNKMTTYEERYQIFLFIALVFLCIEFFIPERGRQKAEWHGRF